MEWVFGRMFGLAGGIAKESTGNPVACQQPVADPSSVPSSSPQRASMQSPPTDEVAARAEERRTSGPPPGAGGANLHSSSEVLILFLSLPGASRWWVRRKSFWR